MSLSVVCIKEYINELRSEQLSEFKNYRKGNFEAILKIDKEIRPYIYSITTSRNITERRRKISNKKSNVLNIDARLETGTSKYSFSKNKKLSG